MANNNPIFSRVGDIQGGAVLTTAAADYTGISINNIPVFTADATNGGFVQRLRFKAIGTNVATVARIYINVGLGNQVTQAGAPGTPGGSGSTTGGTLLAGTYYCKVQEIDQYGVPTAASAESTVVTTTGSTSSIAWSWTAATAAASYRVWIGTVTGGQQVYFTTNTNSYNQTAAYIAGQFGMPLDYLSNNLFIGEVSLPATTAATAAGTADIDYPLNFALPPGYRILVGLGAVVAAGWAVTTIAGKY